MVVMVIAAAWAASVIANRGAADPHADPEA
jgi:hypothetical protein